MIKFYRQIRQRLLRENRFSSYLLYALGEIILVVIGILIALAVNNWSTERHEHVRAMRLLRNLMEEMRQDSAHLGSVRNAEQNLFLPASRRLFFAHSAADVHDIRDSLGISFRYACFVPVIKYSDNAYREMTSSDLFDDSRYDKLKGLIHRYYGQINFMIRYADQVDPFIITLFQELQHYYFVVSGADPDWRMLTHSGAAEDQIEIEYDIVAFRQNQSLNPQLYELIDIHMDRIGGLEIIRKLREEIFGEIRGVIPQH